MMTVLLDASEAKSGGGAWSEMWPILLGAAAALIGSLIATLLSQRHQRQMAEDERLEARRAPARALVLKIVHIAKQWVTAAESFTQLIGPSNPDCLAHSLDQQLLLINRYTSSRLELGRELSIATAEASLVFKEKPLLDSIDAVQLAAREPDVDASIVSPKAYEYGDSDSGITLSERTLNMTAAHKALYSAAAASLRTPLDRSSK